MRSTKVYYAILPALLIASTSGQTPVSKAQLQMNPVVAPPRPAAPKVATTIPKFGIHMTSAIGAFKIKRGSEALNYGTLKISFQGTILISGLKGKATPGNGAELELSQITYKKSVFHSKGKGTLDVTGQFAGIQFFGQNVDAYYRGDGVIQMFGEFDKNLNTGFYWYDQNPSDKKYWGTSGMTITPSPFAQSAGVTPQIKIKNITGKG